MSVKQLEKLLDSLHQLHTSHLSHWAEVEPRLVKAARSATNHRRQGEVFRDLAVLHLEVTSLWPETKDRLLHKLDTIRRQQEGELEEQAATLAAQAASISQLAEQASTLASKLPLETLVTCRPGWSPPATRLEAAADLASLYLQAEEGVRAWLEGWVKELGVWRLAGVLELPQDRALVLGRPDL